MADRIRAFDWDTTPLGPIETWSQSLRTTVQICLDSAVPSFVWWGPKLIQLYNDAALTIVREKHPQSLGRAAPDAWAEVWVDVEDLVASVLETGVAVRGDDLPLMPDRGGPRETAWFTFSYGPARDETGAVAGVYCSAIETTARMQAERTLRAREERQAFLVELGDAMRSLGDPASIQTISTRMLAEHLKVDRAHYGEVLDDAGDEARISVHNGFGRGLPAIDNVFRYHGGPWLCTLLESYRAGRTVVCADVYDYPGLGLSEARAISQDGFRSFTAVPLVEDGNWRAVLAVHCKEPRIWEPGEIELIEETAGRTWSAVERARAESALRENELSLQVRVDSATAELRTLSRRLLVVQEEERRRLALELHDEIGQRLTGLVFQLGAGSQLQGAALTEARQIAIELTEQVRHLSMQLRPGVLDSYGLVPALRWMLERFERQTNIHVRLDQEDAYRRFPVPVEIAGYRITQEALTNVVRHSSAQSVIVQLFADERILTISIRDDGGGFDPNAITTGSGLCGMRERATLLGGTLIVDATAAGVAVTAELPLDERNLSGSDR